MNAPGSSALCFGKLPSHADFIRFNAASREVQAFDEWLHHGLYFARTQLGTGWEEEFMRAPSYRFIFNPDNTQRTLAGVLQPSQDKSQRRYPFLVSLLLDNRWLRESDAHLAPAAFSPFFDGAGQLIQRAMNGLEAREIGDQTQALNCPEPEPQDIANRYRAEFLDAVAISSFWDHVTGAWDDPGKYLIFKNLGDVLLPVRHRNFSRMNLGLRFPLRGADTPADVMTCFWLQVTLIMLGPSGGKPFLFWNAPRDGMPGYLFLFFRQPSPRNFVQLLRPSTESETICAVEEEGKRQITQASASLAPGFRTLLDRRDGTLSGFIKGLSNLVS